jgi:hypothetical protein
MVKKLSTKPGQVLAAPTTFGSISARVNSSMLGWIEVAPRVMPVQGEGGMIISGVEERNQYSLNAPSEHLVYLLTD